MPDEKKPDEKTTVHFAAVPAWAVDLKMTMTNGFSRVDANLGLLASDLDVVKGRVGNLEQARANDEARANANSLKVSKISDADMAQEAKLADVIVWRSAVEKKLTDIEAKTDRVEAKTDLQSAVLGRLDKISKDPRIIALALAAAAAVLTWLRSLA